jgi:hypothetical protein
VSRSRSTDDGRTRAIFIVMTMDEHYTKTSLAATLAWTAGSFTARGRG